MRFLFVKKLNFLFFFLIVYLLGIYLYWSLDQISSELVLFFIFIFFIIFIYINLNFFFFYFNSLSFNRWFTNFIRLLNLVKIFFFFEQRFLKFFKQNIFFFFSFFLSFFYILDFFFQLNQFFKKFYFFFFYIVNLNFIFNIYRYNTKFFFFFKNFFFKKSVVWDFFIFKYVNLTLKTEFINNDNLLSNFKPLLFKNFVNSQKNTLKELLRDSDILNNREDSSKYEDKKFSSKKIKISNKLKDLPVTTNNFKKVNVVNELKIKKNKNNK